MIFGQHGHAKSTMLEDGIAAGSLSGVILSTQNETRASMDAYVQTLRNQQGPNFPILVDPLFQAFMYPPTKLGRLPGYPYFPGQQIGIAQLTHPQTLTTYVDSVVDYQAGLPVSRILSPTVVLDSFNGQLVGPVLSMINQAIIRRQQMAYAQPLLASLVIAETAFSNSAGLNQFLNSISALDVHGFYVVVHRVSHDYPAPMTPTTLQNIMFFAYSLAEVNQYEYVAGYSDLIGLNLHAAGATATASGWYFGCRQHTDRKFTGGRGRSPLARYTSSPLLTSILVDELRTAHTRNFKVPLLSNSPFDQQFIAQPPQNVPWPPATSIAHHWYVMAAASQQIRAAGAVSARLNTWQAMITAARQLFAQGQQAGIVFSNKTGPRDLVTYWDGVAQFRNATGV